MSIVAVCPVHGAFASRMLGAANSRIEFRGVTETCPQCGRESPMMEGRYSFDAGGIATALSAPQWSVDALAWVQSDLQAAAAALKDEENYDSARAYALLDRKLDDISVRMGEIGAQLAAPIRDAKKTEPRRNLWKVVAAVAGTVGFLASVQPAYEFTADTVHNAINWAVTMYDQGHEPRPQDFPLPPPPGG